MLSLTALFLRILKLGATAYGGPGMISHIKEMDVNEKGWVKEAEFMRGMALCQLIPGGHHGPDRHLHRLPGQRSLGSPYSGGGLCSPGIYRNPGSFRHLFQIS